MSDTTRNKPPAQAPRSNAERRKRISPLPPPVTTTPTLAVAKLKPEPGPAATVHPDDLLVEVQVTFRNKAGVIFQANYPYRLPGAETLSFQQACQTNLSHFMDSLKSYLLAKFMQTRTWYKPEVPPNETEEAEPAADKARQPVLILDDADVPDLSKEDELVPLPKPPAGAVVPPPPQFQAE